MRRRAVLLGALLPLLLVTLVGAQSLTSIPTDPAGARGSATLCYNAVATEWQPCSVANPLQVGGVTFPTTQNVNVQQWGGVNTTLGQKPMASSLPVTMASDQPAMPISGTVGVSGTVTTSIGSAPPTAALASWVRAGGSVCSGTANARVQWLNDSVAYVACNGVLALSTDHGHTWAGFGGGSGPGLDVSSMAVSGSIILIGGTTNDGQGSVWRSVDGGAIFARINLPTCAVSTTSKVGLAGTTAVAFAGCGAFRSTDSGGTWTKLDAVNYGTDLSGEAIRLPDNVTWLSPNTIVGLMRSTDDGQTWTSVRAAAAYSYGVISSTTILATQNTTTLIRSTDGGGTWSNIFTFSGSARTITAVPAGSTTSFQVYLSTSRAMRTSNGGSSWVDVGPTLTANQPGSASAVTSAKANSLGEVLLADAQGGGINSIAYSPLLLPGQAILVDTTGKNMGISLNPLAAAPVQGATLFNSQATSAVNTAVTVTIAVAASTRAHVYATHAFCSAGTSTLTITDGGTTIWGTTAGEITTARFQRTWTPGLTAETNSQVVVTLATCGAGNTGTLHVQADRF